MGLKEVFEEAAEKAKALPSASNEEMLDLYKNFKQANMGDCTTGEWAHAKRRIRQAQLTLQYIAERPGGLFNQKEKAKWDAWNSAKGTSKDDAMKAYVAKVDSLAGTSLASKI